MKSGNFCFAHLNVRSLFSKVDQIDYILKKNDYDVLAISESWLDNTIADSELSIEGYNIYRKYRLNSKGGCVCLYVKECVHFKLRDDLHFDDVESLWGEVTVGKMNVLISVVYRPPSAPTAYFESLLDMLEKAKVCELEMIVLGDLNYNYVIDETLCKNPLYYIELLHDMKQLILDKTRVTEKSQSTLDVILTTRPDLHVKSGVVKTTLSDHFLIYTELNVPKSAPDQIHNLVRYRDYKDFSISDFIQDVKSNTILNATATNEISWDAWKSKFQELSDKHAPTKTIRMKSRSNPWITREIISMMNERDRLHNKAVKTHCEDTMQSYRKLRNHITNTIKLKKNIF